jgi:hypothetical protein
VFIANPKSGSATIHYTLLDCIKDKELINESRHRLGDKHLSCSALIEQRPQYKNYFKFAFVRNPWHRVVSWYFFEKKCKNSRRNTSNISFKDYINDSKCKNGIWANIQQYQYEFTKNCDFIGRTENLKEDFNIVCDKIQIPRPKLIIQNTNLSTYNTVYDRDYTEYYDEETREIVAEVFAKDIEYFGYKFGDNVK